MQLTKTRVIQLEENTEMNRPKQLSSWAKREFAFRMQIKFLASE